MDEDKEEEIINHLKEDLENIREDLKYLSQNGEDPDSLQQFADDISQLNEDAKEAEDIYQFSQDAKQIQHLLNTPLWGNISLLHAADHYDNIEFQNNLFFDLIEEFIKHPEQYQELFGSFETLLRRMNHRS